jgi:hypothetical protein
MYYSFCSFPIGHLIRLLGYGRDGLARRGPLLPGDSGHSDRGYHAGQHPMVAWTAERYFSYAHDLGHQSICAVSVGHLLCSLVAQNTGRSAVPLSGPVTLAGAIGIRNHGWPSQPSANRQIAVAAVRILRGRQ